MDTCSSPNVDYTISIGILITIMASSKSLLKFGDSSPVKIHNFAVNQPKPKKNFQFRRNFETSKNEI